MSIVRSFILVIVTGVPPNTVGMSGCPCPSPSPTPLPSLGGGGMCCEGGQRLASRGRAGAGVAAGSGGWRVRVPLSWWRR